MAPPHTAALYHPSHTLLNVPINLPSGYVIVVPLATWVEKSGRVPSVQLPQSTHRCVSHNHYLPFLGGLGVRFGHQIMRLIFSNRHPMWPPTNFSVSFAHQALVCQFGGDAPVAIVSVLKEGEELALDKKKNTLRVNFTKPSPQKKHLLNDWVPRSRTSANCPQLHQLHICTSMCTQHKSLTKSWYRFKLVHSMQIKLPIYLLGIILPPCLEFLSHSLRFTS